MTRVKICISSPETDVPNEIGNRVGYSGSIETFSGNRPLSSDYTRYMNELHGGSAPKRILIVEDNPPDLRLLTDILVAHGYETLQTRHGLEAINLASTNLPDLILMDIQLPDVSGLEVTRRLKDDDRSKRIPIIAVTAFAMEWHEREALDSGCDAYLSKPITIFGFLRTVESFLSPVSSSPGFAEVK